MSLGVSSIRGLLRDIGKGPNPEIIPYPDPYPHESLWFEDDEQDDKTSNQGF